MAIDFIHLSFRRVPNHEAWPVVGWHIIPACRRNDGIISIEKTADIISNKFLLEEDWQERSIVNETEFEIQNIKRHCIRIISYEIGLYAQVPEWWYHLSGTLNGMTDDLISICQHLPIIAIHDF